MYQCQPPNLPLVHAQVRKQANCVLLPVDVRVRLTFARIQLNCKIKCRKMTADTDQKLGFYLSLIQDGTVNLHSDTYI